MSYSAVTSNDLKTQKCFGAPLFKTAVAGKREGQGERRNDIKNMGHHTHIFHSESTYALKSSSLSKYSTKESAKFRFIDVIFQVAEEFVACRAL